MRILVKVGGAELEQDAARARLAAAVARARAAGHEVVLVHGGGNQIRELSRRLGLAERYHEGLRVTDGATADVVLQVLAGLVNKTLVEALVRGGVRAAGLSGADAGTFWAERHAPGGADLGYVGRVARADPALVETLLAAGLVPVIATAAPLAPEAEGARDHHYNVNADAAAGPLAAAFGCDALVFLTDVPGVLDAQRSVLPALTAAAARALRERGVISGGMIPKVEAALAARAALREGRVQIAPAGGEDAILAALSGATGTRFEREVLQEAR